MPKLNEMIESKFIKKDDVGDGILVTITGVDRYNVAMQGAPEELKWCLDFREIEKPLVLNVTNMRVIETTLGSDNTDDWIGKQIVLYNDPSVMYKGEIKGGVRVRASRRPQPVPKVSPQPISNPSPGDEIPFD